MAVLRPPRLVLDDPEGGCERSFENPQCILRADHIDEVDEIFRRLDEAIGSGRYVAGYVAYELGHALERRLQKSAPQATGKPLLWFGVFPSFSRRRPPSAPAGGRWHAGPLVGEWDENAYRARFAAVHELIAAGDLYQANLSFRMRFAFDGDAESFYRALKASSAARHCAFVDDGERQILSLSPELFFDMTAEGRLRARPMKGTAARGRTAEEDAASRHALVASPKERAENLMIVDLLRNDLSRIARVGSVQVDGLFEVESYPTIHTMVSTISAQRAPGKTPSNILRALFPCGSVTGAPKIRAMEIIREMESSSRGVYCGAIGHFSPDGSASFNVAIRTITIAQGSAEIGIGGAVVFDSQPHAEYAECLLKARFLDGARHPLELIETLRYAPDEGLVRQHLHLARMQRSAMALGMIYEEEAARAELLRAVSPGEAHCRVRLVLQEDGAFRATTSPLPQPPARPWRVTISNYPVSSLDPLLYHKTSARHLYDHEFARAVERGFDEILFVNERGELTEGSRTNIFLESSGELLTPALGCGLLDGCLRRELLDGGLCREARLTPADVARAGRLFVGNSLRGLLKAELVP